MGIGIDRLSERGSTGELHGFTAAATRALELHEAHAHVRGTRRLADLGDAILLLDAVEPDPFLNRLSALRLPRDPAAFDRRLTELLGLFAAAGRQAHAWLSPAFGEPADIGDRLGDDGFLEVGSVHMLVLDSRSGPSAASARPLLALPSRSRMVRLSEAGPRRATVIRGVASVLADAFGPEGVSAADIAADLAETHATLGDVCLLTVRGQPVATGRRFTADGATYLSSIGTRRMFWGRGFASAVTAALIDDGRAAGGPLVHLGVETGNARALAMYRRLGFEVLGAPRADLLLA